MMKQIINSRLKTGAAGLMRRSFQKGLFLVALAMLLVQGSFAAATRADQYSFTRTTGTYSSISATGTPYFGINCDDCTNGPIGLGFTFNYCGVDYTQVIVSSNGTISLSGVHNSSLSADINSITAGWLFPFWADDHGGHGGNFTYYSTTGSAGNQVFTFEYNNWDEFANSNVGHNVQLKLYEGTNLIQFCYGTHNFDAHIMGIGIGNASDDYQNLESTNGTTCISALPNGGNCFQPADGSILQWSPDFVGPISGTLTICAGSTTALSDATIGGSWSTPDATIATVDASGIVTGLSAGTATISYTMGSATATAMVTVNARPSIDMISSNGPICSGTTLSLNSSASGGTGTLVYSWHGPAAYSALGANQSIGSAPVSANGTYTLTVTDDNLCSTSGTTNASVSFTAAIAGVVDIMANGSSRLSDATAGGTWSSSDPGIAAVSTVGAVTASATAGSAIITYQVGTTCPSQVTVNVYPQALCIGTAVLLTDSVSGGTWSTAVPAIATVNANTGLVGGVNVGTTVIRHITSTTLRNYTVTVNVLQPVTGLEKVCQTAAITMGNNTAGGGTWSSGNTSIATMGTTTGIFGGVSGGFADAVFITARGCMAAKNVQVNPTAPIVVPGPVCVGQTITATNAVSGGTWSSSVPGMASVSLNTGLVYGIATGTPVLSYGLPTGCIRTSAVTVNPLSQTTGVAALCAGLSTTLGNVTTGGGTWSSNNGNVTIGLNTGVATAVSAGTSTIAFTTIRGCVYSKTMTINPVPAISGTTTVCVAQTTQLSSSVNGGTWSSNIPGMAGVNITTGLVSGVSAGTPLITYGLPTGCIKSTTLAVNPLVASTGPATICAAHTVVLANSTSAGTWTSSNSTVATVNLTTGVVSGVTAGTANIMFTTIRGCVTTKAETVNICPGRQADPTSVATVAGFGEMRIFPNPNTGTFTVKGTMAATDEQEVTFTVINMLGQVVYRNTHMVTDGVINESIQLAGSMANGNYMLDLHSGSEQKVFHFVISK